MTVITSCVLGTVTLNCTSIVKNTKTQIAKINIPNRSAPIIQHMGHGDRTIDLKGYLTSNIETDKATLEGYRDGTSVQTYVDTEEGSISTIVLAVNIQPIAGQTASYPFVIKLLKYEQV